MKRIKSDYLIIGSGLAGLYAAHIASKYGSVALLTKNSIDTSCTYLAQGGIASAMDDSDSPEFHFEDTIKAGRGLCDEAAVRILVNEGPKRITELIEEGLSFDKSDNEYDLGLESGHSRRRILHLSGNESGRIMVNFLSGKIRSTGNIKIYENHPVYKLIVEDNTCIGAYAYDRNNKTECVLNANVTLIASGGAAGIYKRSTNPDSAAGDGIVLAYNEGAEACNMELIQFHPTAFYAADGKTFLLSESLRGEGGYLLNNEGKRFMQQYHEAAELAPRDIVAEAIFRESEKEKAKHLYLSLTHLNKYFIKSRFKNIYEKALEYNIDITTDKIPVAPAAHYTIGGIKTNLNGETNINRLYAAGEASFTGVHGANRLASNSLTECIVFSHRAIEDSLKYSSNEIYEDYVADGYIVNERNSGHYLALKDGIKDIMNKYAGIVRDKKSLLIARGMILSLDRDFNYEQNEYYTDRLKALKTISLLIIEGALAREESRGCHIRTDFLNENVQKYNTVQSLNGGIRKVFLINAGVGYQGFGIGYKV